MGKNKGANKEKPGAVQGMSPSSKVIGKKNQGKPQKGAGSPAQKNQKPIQNKKKETKQSKENKQPAPQMKKKPQNPQKITNGDMPKSQPKNKQNAKKTEAKTKPQGVTKKNKQNPKPQSIPKPETETESDQDSDEETPEPKIVSKLDKRSKNRVKAEIKKEIILKGKSTAVLTNPDVVRKKLAKFKAKPEPRSVKIQKKILLLENLLNRLTNEASKTDDKKDNVKKGAADKVVATQNGTDEDEEKFPRNKFVIFVGHLKPSVSEDMVKDHFKDSGEIQRLAMPVPKRRKSKRFAFIQFDSEESRQNALKLHETMLGDCKINVLYANKSKDKNAKNKNKDLQTQRKVGDKKMKEIGKKLKNNKNKENKVNKMQKSSNKVAKTKQKKEIKKE